MRHLLIACMVSLTALAAGAQTLNAQPVATKTTIENPTTTDKVIYKKQTMVRYQAPVCDNCKTTTTVTKTKTPVGRPVKHHGCDTCQQNVMPPVEYQPVPKQVNYQPEPRPYYPAMVPPSQTKRTTNNSSCVYNNHDYAIGNPLFVLKANQVSSETVAGYSVNPRKTGPILYYDHGEPVRKATPRWTNWQVAERIGYGINDWLSVHAQAGYTQMTPEKAYRKAVVNPTRYRSDTNGMLGVEAHAIDSCYFDAIVGMDVSYHSIKDERKSSHTSINNMSYMPYAILGGQIGFVTPYLQAAYIVNSKSEFDNAYSLVPGLYIQPNKYFAVHPYINKMEHEKPQWNLAFDFYPYKNMVIGIEGNGVSLTEDPVDMFGFSAHMKMVF